MGVTRLEKKIFFNWTTPLCIIKIGKFTPPNADFPPTGENRNAYLVLQEGTNKAYLK